MPPMDENDNPTLISVSESGEVMAYYMVGAKFDIWDETEFSHYIYGSSPITLRVRVTSNRNPVENAHVTFYVLSKSIGSVNTDSDGYASIEFYPKEERVYSWYATIEKSAYASGTSRVWDFAFQKVWLNPPDNKVLTEIPIYLSARVELEDAPVEDAIVTYFIDDENIGFKKPQPNGYSTFAVEELKAGSHKWYVTVKIPGWNAILSDVQNLVYLPQMTANLDYPKNDENITDYVSTIKLRAVVKSEGRPVEGANASFYVMEGYVGSNITDVDGAASFGFVPPKENETYEWNIVVSKPLMFNYSSPPAKFHYPE